MYSAHDATCHSFGIVVPTSVFLFHLRSTSFGIVATTNYDAVVFDVENGEGMS